MMNEHSRRAFLLGAGTGGLAAVFPLRTVWANENPPLPLSAAPGRLDLVNGQGPETDVWAYSSATGPTVPGPEIRVRQSDLLRVDFKNALPQETTVHWHGIRLPNAMDGVPGLTQKPVGPGQSFRYRFRVPDAGTYWYHPHVKSSEQTGRGLYGALIVEERRPPKVDRDVTWVLDDWRLDENNAIHESFSNMHDMSHAGRLGNLVTLNGVDSDRFAVRAGERLRLRLINAANARSFALNFSGHAPVVIALDGHPVSPWSPPAGRVVLGSGQRADLIVDMVGKPGETFVVEDDYTVRRPYRFVDLVYAKTPPLRPSPLDAPVALPPNPLPTPAPGQARTTDIRISGGAMGKMRSARYKGRETGIRELVGQGKVWAINGEVFDPAMLSPLLTVGTGTPLRLRFFNDTAWPHPMHLHGHAFKIESRNGIRAEREIWTDTVLLARDERVEVLFVADNPGDWLLHCHILEHHEAGMASVIRIT